MAEEKSNLEPLEEGDLDLKRKFSGITAPKKPESVIAEVKEEIIPKFNERTEQKAATPNLEPLADKDVNLEAKFSGVAAQRGIEEIPQETKVEEKKFNFPKMSIKKEEPIEKKIESAPIPETVAEKKETQAEKTNLDSPENRITISRPLADPSVAEDAHKAAKDRDISSRVETLVRIAEQKGIPHAVKVAQHMDDNYTLDEFHDYLLTEELNRALIERGLIQEI